LILIQCVCRVVAKDRYLGLFQFTRYILTAALPSPGQANRFFRLDVAESPTRQFPDARRRLLARCLLARIRRVVWWLWVSRLVPTLEGPTGAPAESEVPLDAIGPPGAGPLQNLPSRPPSLLVTLAALGAALGVAALVAVFLALILPRLRRRASAGLLSDLAERAGVAARRIRGGEDPREVVLACYSEMSTLLAKAHRVPGVAFLTAREFAALLREAGMGEGHVDRLTAIFEDVRYGWRAGERLAEEAVSCLEAIRTGHALEGT
jgi:hypothetical protein